MSESGKHLEEILKERHEAELNRKTTLDDKSNNVITGGSTIAGIYLGFGIAVITEFFKTVFQLNSSAIVLLIGTIALVLSIIIAARSFLLRNYTYPFNYNQLIKSIDSENKIVYDDTKIDDFINRDSANFNKLMIKIYCRCIILNSKENNSKAKHVLWSQIIFLIGLSSLPVFVLTLLPIWTF